MPARRPSDSFDDELPVDDRIETDDSEVAPLDNEIDFDDESDSDQLPLDQVEAREAGVYLDDPDEVDDDDDPADAD